MFFMECATSVINCLHIPITFCFFSEFNPFLMINTEQKHNHVLSCLGLVGVLSAHGENLFFNINSNHKFVAIFWFLVVVSNNLRIERSLDILFDTPISVLFLGRYLNLLATKQVAKILLDQRVARLVKAYFDEITGTRNGVHLWTKWQMGVLGRQQKLRCLICRF